MKVSATILSAGKTAFIAINQPIHSLKEVRDYGILSNISGNWPANTYFYKFNERYGTTKQVLGWNKPQIHKYLQELFTEEVVVKYSN